jgi:hypothetical protein
MGATVESTLKISHTNNTPVEVLLMLWQQTNANDATLCVTLSACNKKKKVQLNVSKITFWNP